jgi:hypothetical protein
LFRTIEAVNRLDVKDINRDGIFVSKRISSPTDPLNPTYTWRDTKEMVNQQYGNLGNQPRHLIADRVNRKNDLAINPHDIEGAKANSLNDRRYFLSVPIPRPSTAEASKTPSTPATSPRPLLPASRKAFRLPGT